MAKQKKNKISTPKEDITYYYPDDIPEEDRLYNESSCFNPPAFYDRSCHECNFVKSCVYRRKYQYFKPN